VFLAVAMIALGSCLVQGRKTAVRGSPLGAAP
jgi:hypothetical protein